MKKLLPIILLAASCGSQTNTNEQVRVNMPKDPALDSKQPSLMPTKPTNGAPIRLQSAQPQQIAPTFADGVRLGFMVARRNQDLNDLQAAYAYAVQFWQQEAAQRAQAHPSPVSNQP